MGVAQWTDTLLKRCGVRTRPRRLVLHYASLLGEQLAAMLPLSLLQIFVLAVFFKKAPDNPGIAAAGLLSAVLGLVLFLDALRLAIMPMAMEVGKHLPQKMPLPIVLLVAFCLGVLVTYAEPAIAAIRPLASLVDPQSAPYLYFVLNQRQEITVLSIGLGVGFAAVLGMLKFMYDLSLKALIAGSLIPTLAAACWMQWGNPHLAPLLGMAWDCGAVTTGPVTVPILIALGVACMKAQRQKEQALAALEEAAESNIEDAKLEGFGIVTLASLLPILAVEVMGIITSLTHPYEQVLQEVAAHAAAASTATEPLVNRSPLREVIFALRAILPLCAALLLLLLVLLRVPLPASHFDTAHGAGDADDTTVQLGGGRVEEEEEEGGEETEEGSTCGSDKQSHHRTKHHQQKQQQKHRTSSSPQQQQQQIASARTGAGHKHAADASSDTAQQEADNVGQRPKSAAAAAADAAAAASLQAGGNGKIAAVATDKAAPQQQEIAVAVARECSSSTPREWAGSCGSGGAPAVTTPPSAATGGCCGRLRSGRARCHAWLSEHSALLWGMVMAQIGMVLFNLGLVYGFTALGDLTGTWLPTSFMQLPYAPGSPYYSIAAGVTITMVTVFLLGVLATNAEPALNVLGQTVESLSQGQFSKRLLVWAVSIGVAVGMVAGACKILFTLPLIYFIIAKYAVASALTVITKEEFTAIAWDSAGVTTGPITVPFVLSIGLAFGRAVGAAEGFGMLTVMSVAPIISVLITSLLRKPVEKAATELVRVSTNLARYSLERISRTSRGGAGGSSSYFPPLSSRSQGLLPRDSQSFGLAELRHNSSIQRSSSGNARGMRSLACRSAPPVRSSAAPPACPNNNPSNNGGLTRSPEG